MKNNISPSQSPVNKFQEREITIRDYTRILVKRKTTALTFLVIVFLTVVIVTYTATPFYTSSSQVLIEQNFNSNDIERQQSYIRHDPDFLATQFQLISSANVAHRAVKTLQLDTRYRSFFINTTEKEKDSFFTAFKSKIKTISKRIFSSQSEQTTTPPSDGADLLTETESVTDAEIIATKI